MGASIYFVKLSGLSGPPSTRASGGDSSCCANCDSEAWCSPNSGNCYTWKKRDYYESCTPSQPVSGSDPSCCGNCESEAWCSPNSGNCYTWKKKDYYESCTPSQPVSGSD